ncbi:MAG: BMP family ABC transporter substrate-binding protein [Clostridiales bacterium]|nr:BMP family ABC transporter substrate-binding protein [Clostridiales bacterium]
MKKISKVIAIIMSLVLVFSLAACGANSNKGNSNLKVGFIFIHDENSTYDKNFIDAAEAVCQELGVTCLKKTNVPESNKCYEAAADLVDQGCTLIFADSFGHENFIIQAAKEFTNVQFCHATGTQAHTANLSNFHNAFASIYEGRYLAGIAAGMKLNEMINAGKINADEAKMGYVGAYTYAEVISGYTSFYLGAKSVCPSVTMEVQFTGSWYDEAQEKEAANKLISNKCVLISQHADSMGAPTACETANVPNISYNGSTLSACPNSFIVSSKIDWAPYFRYIINSVKNGTAIDTDWSKGYQAGSVALTDVNTTVAAAGTKEAIDKAIADINAGTLKIFDVSTFTVTVDATKKLNASAKVDADGHLTSYMADVDTDDAYTPDTEVVKDGYFHESEYRSAPYFDLQIDGITLLNAKF